MKKPLIVLAILTAALLLLKVFFLPPMATSPWLVQFTALLLAWLPGFVGLYFARKENLHLPLFRGVGKGYFMIPLYAFGVTTISTLAMMAFGATTGFNVALTQDGMTTKVIFAVVSTILISLVLITLFLSLFMYGGEIFWRGYVWARLEHLSPIKRVGISFVLWTVWVMIISFFYYTPGTGNLGMNLLSNIYFTFALTPILFYFRLKHRAIFASVMVLGYLAAFYAIGCYLFFAEAPLSQMMVYGGLILLVIVLLNLCLKLFLPRTWEKLAQS